MAPPDHDWHFTVTGENIFPFAPPSILNKARIQLPEEMCLKKSCICPISHLLGILCTYWGRGGRD